MKRLDDLKRLEKVKKGSLVKNNRGELFKVDYISENRKVHLIKSDNVEYLDTMYPILATIENEDLIFDAIGIDIECDFHLTQKKCVFWNKGKLYFKNGIQVKKLKYIHDLQNIFDKYDEKLVPNMNAENNQDFDLF